MKTKVTLQDIQQDADTDAAFNDGIGAGLEIGLRNAWTRIDRNDPSTWPPFGVPFVGYWEYNEVWGDARLARIEANGKCYPAWGDQKQMNLPCHWMPSPRHATAP